MQRLVVKSFKNAVDMIEASIAHGTLKGKFKSHCEFVDETSSDNNEYIKFLDAFTILSGANNDWSHYYTEKAVKRGILRIFRKPKYSDRWLLIDDVNKLKDMILGIKDPITTNEGICRFTEIFNCYRNIKYEN